MPNLNGTAGDDILTGGGDTDTLVGNAGSDRLNGAGADDLLVGNSGADILDGGDGSDRLFAGDESPPFNQPYYGNPYTPPLLDTGSEIDTLIGGGGDDRLFAGYGDNVDGGSNGYAGDYLYISFLGASAGVTVDFRQQTQVVGGGTITNIENISWVQGSDFDDNINVGSWSNNGYSNFTAVFGRGGNDRLTAGYYTGVLFGEEGNDMLDGRGSQYLQSLEGGNGDDILYGASGTNTAYGGAGNDTIYNGSATYGGAGDDLIIMQTSYYSGQVHGDEGNDDIRAAQTGNFIVGGVGADRLTGDAGADTLISDRQVNGVVQPSEDMGSERDILAGFGGADTLSAGYGDDVDGGSGVDTLILSLSGAATGVILDTTALAAGQALAVGGGTLRNVEILRSLRGSEFNDILTLATQSSLLSVNAGAGDDVVRSFNSSLSVLGGVGNDRLISGAAGDIFDGEAGIDTVDYSFYASGVTVSLLTGAGPGGDVLRNVENLNGSAYNDSLTGNGGDNVLNGGEGNDFLLGGFGNDTLNGDVGTDYALYQFTTATSSVTFSASGIGGGGPVVQVDGAGGTDTLNGIEGAYLIGSDFNDILTGGSGGDILAGQRGNDSLVGGDGNDLLRGDAGSDNLHGGAGFDWAVYRFDDIGLATGVTFDASAVGQSELVSISDSQGGIDALREIEAVTVSGSNFVDTVIGSAFSDVIDGMGGEDIITGGGGGDTLTGGAGADVFRYLVTSDSTAAASDTITDFQVGVDRIDLTALNPTSVSIARLAGGGTVVFAETAGGAFQTFVAGASLNGGDFVFNGGFGVFVIGSEGADVIQGTAVPDPLVGNGGDDVITGGGGADAIAGGAGRDVFRYVSRGDSNQTTGFDNLYDFTSGEDRLDLTLLNASSISILRTDNGSSFIYAETAAGVFLTTVANRTVQATDITFGSGPNGVGALGIYMVGSGVNDVLVGTSLADPIAGGAGNDTITGGGGADAMFGDGGADTFVYLSASDSTAAASDGIFGFVSGTDRLDLRAVRTGAADTFGIAYLSGGSYLFVDLGGNGTSDLVIGLANTTLVAGDILWNTGAIGEEPGVKAAGPEVLPVEDRDALFDGDLMSGLSPMTGRWMLDLEGARGFHGQDWWM